MGREGVSSTLTLAVSRCLLTASAETLRELAGGVRESVILWTGIERASGALVRRMIIPRQRATAIGFEVSMAERLRIAQELADSGEKLLAQLHTHPRDAFHSPTDDRLALPRHTGAISIVVPNFGGSWDGDLRDVSINLHLGGGVWTELDSDATATLFEVK